MSRIAGIAVLLSIACSVGCAYKGAAYTYRKNIGVEVATRPTENAPAGINVGYDQSTVAVVPKYDTENRKGEIASLISRSNTKVLLRAKDAQVGERAPDAPQYLQKSVEGTTVRVDDAVISGAAALVASTPSGQRVSLKTGRVVTATLTTGDIEAAAQEATVDLDDAAIRDMTDALGSTSPETFDRDYSAALSRVGLSPVTAESEALRRALLARANFDGEIVTTSGNIGDRIGLALAKEGDQLNRFLSAGHQTLDTALRTLDEQPAIERDAIAEDVVSSVDGLLQALYDAKREQYRAARREPPGPYRLFDSAVNDLVAYVRHEAFADDLYRRIAAAINQSLAE